MGFSLYPAIDLKGGQVVRLKRGEMDQATIYADDPAAQARAAHNRAALAQLAGIDRERLSQAGQLNLDVVRYQLETRLGDVGSQIAAIQKERDQRIEII